MGKKALVVYYSRTGTTKKVAQQISNILGCDIEEIFDTKDRSGAFGYLMAGRDATKKSLTTISPITNNPGSYDIVVIGTPVWAFTMATPIRTYIQENKDKFKNVAFFCTQGGSGSDRTFKHMEELCGKTPLCQLELKTIEVVKNQFEDKTNSFADLLK